jgi:hypothetical protein
VAKARALGPVAQIVRAASLEHKQGPARVLQVMQETLLGPKVFDVTTL